MKNSPPRLLLAFVVLCIATQAKSIPQDETEKENCRIVTGADLNDASAPHFEFYPVKDTRSPRAPRLDLSSNRIARQYRTVLRGEISEGANFAGHYRVAVWGCGSSCAMVAVVNLRTGKVMAPRGIHAVSGVWSAADEFLPDTDSDSWGFRFKRTSRLLVIIGMPNQSDSRQGAFYFLLKNETLVPIHTTIVKKTCGTR